MSDADGATIVFNVRLKPVDYSNLPHQANFSNVVVDQGMAYLEFGFLDPSLLRAIVKITKDGQAAPNVIEGQLVTRVAMGANVLARLHQQIQQVLVGLRAARQSKLTETKSSTSQGVVTQTEVET